MNRHPSHDRGDRSEMGVGTYSLLSVLGLALALGSTGTIANWYSSPALHADTGRLPQRIWRNPGDVASLDLINGVGGRAHAPEPAGLFTFVKEDASATSPKFDVVDARGVRWKVKLGDESQPETAATRFLWAAGYLTDEVYFVPALTVSGLPVLKRGQGQVSTGGVVRRARLERQRIADTRLGDWDWFDNPFAGQRELNGLRVMMSLLNSWDLKAMNNSVYLVDGERHYIVSDLGGTFGQTGDAVTRTKGKPGDYRDSKFIDTVTPGFIDFVLYSRPHFLGHFDPPNYRERTRMEDIARHIPRADVRWLAARLSKLTNRQIRDGFRAAGFGAGEVDSLTRTLQRRIAALGAL